MMGRIGNRKRSRATSDWNSYEQFARIWIHTHPGNCAQPSHVDEITFAESFGHCDWAVMCILARGGNAFAQLHWRPGGPERLQMNIDLDFTQPFAATNFDKWQQEYNDNVSPLNHSHAANTPFDSFWPWPEIEDADSDQCDLATLIDATKS